MKEVLTNLPMLKKTNMKNNIKGKTVQQNESSNSTNSHKSGSTCVPGKHAFLIFILNIKILFISPI
jgi:phenylacetate-coenzyme A ligase PaaK-like adenylate-forming protein